MTLPIFQTSIKELSLMQTRWSSIIDPVLSLPTNNGHLLKNVPLQVGSNTINHLLGRKLQGWFIVRLRAASSIYDTQDSNIMPDLTLQLVASLAVVVDLFVF